MCHSKKRFFRHCSREKKNQFQNLFSKYSIIKKKNNKYHIITLFYFKNQSLQQLIPKKRINQCLKLIKKKITKNNNFILI